MAITDWIPQVVDSEKSLVYRTFINEFPGGQHCKGGKESKNGQRQSEAAIAGPMTISANPTESLGAKTALQSCLPVGLEGQAFILPHGSVIVCG